MYIARPYNFNLSPLFLEKDRLGIERTFSFSSGALHFLMGEKVLFDIAAPFNTGVPYLSREEEEYARHKCQNVVHSDVTISLADQDALAFYRNTRNTIKDWLNEPKVDSSLLQRCWRNLEFSRKTNYLSNFPPFPDDQMPANSFRTF